MVMSQRSRLSPTFFNQLMAFTEFKVDFENVSIKARKYPKHLWHKLMYLVSKMDMQEIVGIWLAEWCELTKLGVGAREGAESTVAWAVTTQKCKEVAQKVTRALVE